MNGRTTCEECPIKHAHLTAITHLSDPSNGIYGISITEKESYNITLISKMIHFLAKKLDSVGFNAKTKF